MYEDLALFPVIIVFQKLHIVACCIGKNSCMRKFSFQMRYIYVYVLNNIFVFSLVSRIKKIYITNGQSYHILSCHKVVKMYLGTAYVTTQLIIRLI